MTHPSTAPVRFHAARLGYGRTAVLDGVDFTVGAGEAVALIGDNGAGKSTVLKAIVGLSAVLAGSVEVDGPVGYVPQHADITPEFPITAAEVVGLGLVPELKIFQRIGRAGARRCAEALRTVGLGDQARARFGDLSGGQRQRVLVAKALVARPRVLVLDEPFNGLDRANRKVLIEVIRAEKSRGVAVVVSTHDLELSDMTCERTLTVAGGKVAP